MAGVRSFDIAGVKLGGELGENPTLLVGSVFYHGDKLLANEEEGVFSREKARRVIEDAASLADRYGLRFGLDVIFPSPRSVDRIMPFVSELDLPLFLDSPSRDARIKAYSMAKELGLANRCVANGIGVTTDEEELRAIRESGIRAAVLLAFDPRNPAASMRPEARLEIVRGALLPKAEKAGVDKPLLDAIVLDPASIAISAEAVRLFRTELGLPSGCAPANALGPVSKKAFSPEEVISIHSAVAVMLRVFGTDFILYGPVKRIKHLAPAVAMVDGLLGYLAKQRGARVGRGHPMRTLLRRVQQLFAQGP